MAQYKTCEVCGAHLDHGEACDCRGRIPKNKKKQKQTKAKTKKKKQYIPPLSREELIIYLRRIGMR